MSLSMLWPALAALYTHAADIDFFPFRETFAMLASSVEDE